MNAVVYHGKGDARFEKAPVPACREGELRVRIDACAVCGSDLKTFNSGNPRMKPPMVMGHEFTGLIETVGRGVAGFSVGERIVMATSIACGECWYCRQGWTNLCAKLDPMGFSYPGGMAEYVVVPAVAVRNGHVIKVPLSVPAEHAALAEPLSCAINCVESSVVRQGDTVVVVGAGPLGILILYAAREYGAARLILAAREGRRFDQAKQFACGRLVNTSKEDLAEAVREETNGRGADVAIVAAPSAEAQEQALDLVRKKGRVCLFASLPAGKSTLALDSRPIHYGEMRLVGTSDSTPAQVRKAVEMIAAGRLPADRLATHVLGLDEIGRAYDLMQRGESLRVVLKP
ncbi:MAG: alcohol dehydrogenase catalytic domain-containing protein [Acidobacteria bacterium]|nr:alcohol dehydrogenase catalytic domain-containing protein [Acidobacteriota bacterium]